MPSSGTDDFRIALSSKLNPLLDKEVAASEEQILTSGKGSTSLLSVLIHLFLRIFGGPTTRQLYIENGRKGNAEYNAALLNILSDDPTYQGMSEVIKTHEAAKGACLLGHEIISKGLQITQANQLKNVAWLKSQFSEDLTDKGPIITLLHNLWQLQEGADVSDDAMGSFFQAVLGERKIDSFSESDHKEIKALMNAHLTHPEVKLDHLLKIYNATGGTTDDTMRNRFFRFVHLFEKSKARHKPEEFLRDYLKFVAAYKDKNGNTTSYAFNRWNYLEKKTAFEDFAHDYPIILIDETLKKRLEKAIGEEGFHELIEGGTDFEIMIFDYIESLRELSQSERAFLLLHDSSTLLKKISKSKDLDRETTIDLMKTYTLYPESVTQFSKILKSLSNENIRALLRMLRDLPLPVPETNGDMPVDVSAPSDSDLASKLKGKSDFEAIAETILTSKPPEKFRDSTLSIKYLQRGILLPIEIDNASSEEELKRMEAVSFIQLHYSAHMVPLAYEVLKAQDPDCLTGKKEIQLSALYKLPLEQQIELFRDALRKKLNGDRIGEPFSIKFFERLFKDVKDFAGFEKREKIAASLQSTFIEKVGDSQERKLSSGLTDFYSAFLTDDAIPFYDNPAFLGLMEECKKRMETGYSTEVILHAILGILKSEKQKKGSDLLSALEATYEKFKEEPFGALFVSDLTLKTESACIRAGTDPSAAGRYVAILIEELGDKELEPNQNLLSFNTKAAEIIARATKPTEFREGIRVWLQRKTLKDIRIGMISPGELRASMPAALLASGNFRLEEVARVVKEHPEKLITDLLPALAKAAVPEKRIAIEEAERVLKTNQKELGSMLKTWGVDLNLPTNLAIWIDIYMNTLKQKGGARVIFEDFGTKLEEALNAPEGVNPLEKSAELLNDAVTAALDAVRDSRSSKESFLFQTALPYLYGAGGDKLRSRISSISTALVSYTPDFAMKWLLYAGAVVAGSPFREEKSIETQAALLKILGYLWIKEQSSDHLVEINRLLSRIDKSKELSDSAFEEELPLIRRDLLELIYQIMKELRDGNQVTETFFKSFIALGLVD